MYMWRLIGKGQGIHWEDIDEDIRIEGLIAGRPSGESQKSFQKWPAKRSEKKETGVKPSFDFSGCYFQYAQGVF